jgi:AdoMet-dependent rRNA methyltransferase SPB1
MERDQRRQARRAKKLGETAGDFDLAPGTMDGEDDEDIDDDLHRMEGVSEEKKKKLIEARKLIKAGMGPASASRTNTKDDTKGFEVVEQDRPLPVKDGRNYDSDNEDYDSDDYAKTMALGTMMLRRPKAKALVDASYNRFAWNDPEDLPEWFVDDENRHYRPQLPIPPALLAKMKEKMAALSTKPIAKVAEARARKNRKAKLKLAAAKKKAQAVANSTDMSESMKLKSISKALRSEDGKSGKKYVVSKKGQGKKGVKGAKMVDKRMKNDKRSMDRASNKKKGGKKGGLTGSKRRRHHK